MGSCGERVCKGISFTLVPCRGLPRIVCYLVLSFSTLTQRCPRHSSCPQQLQASGQQLESEPDESGAKKLDTHLLGGSGGDMCGNPFSPGADSSLRAWKPPGAASPRDVSHPKIL